MKVAFYPGCVSRGGCPELYPSAVKVAAQLGLELEELTDVGCNGAGVLSREVSDPINARTFAKAEARGLSTVMTICSTCTGVMGQANIKLREDAAYRERINREFLADEGLAYRGTVAVKHLLWILHEEYGLDRLKTAVKRPLRGVKVSPFYGCYIRRPDAIIEGKPQRKQYLERVIEAVGAEVVDFGGKGRCCGFPILTANETNSMAMVAAHTGEAKGKGADCMVTPCPLCHLNLDGGQPKAEAQTGAPIGLPILHLPQLIGLGLGFSSEELHLKRHIVPTVTVAEKVQLLT